MRSTSRKRRAQALFLTTILIRSSVGMHSAAADSVPDPCILLKVSATSIPHDTAENRLGSLQRILEKSLHVRWIPPAATAEVRHESTDPVPVADEEGLEKISIYLTEAIRHMDRMETEAASGRLDDAETLARSFRLGGATIPYLAEVFLRRGILFLWEGETGKAEEMLARSRVLRPEFVPDPAVFSPPFLAAWKRSGERQPPQAELLVTSLPAGATIYRNGQEAGRTPGRVRVSDPGPVRIEVHADGYLRSGKTGQWLPGDSGTLDFPLVRDRNFLLTETLSSSPDGKEAGPLLTRMLAETGARRAALLILEADRDNLMLRVLSQAQGEDVPVVLGTVRWPEGEEGRDQAAASVVEMLKDAGWPGESGTDTAKGAWYHKWWVWVLVGAATVGIVAGAGGNGGGGDSGSSTGTIGVDFEPGKRIHFAYSGGKHPVPSGHSAISP